MDGVLEFISILGSVIAVFGIFDFLVENQTCNKLSEYIFGFHNVTFHDFETRVIRALLSPFVKDGKLRRWRVLLVYSLIGAFIMAVIVVVDQGNRRVKEIELFEEVFFFWVVLSFSMFISWPFDMWSIHVTRTIFLKPKNEIRFPRTTMWIIGDALISLIPALLFFAFGLALVIPESAQGPEYQAFWSQLILSVVAIGAGASGLSSALISILQVFILFVGTIVRTLLGISRLNTYVAMHSRAHDYPFTFIGLCAGLGLAVLS